METPAKPPAFPRIPAFPIPSGTAAKASSPLLFSLFEFEDDLATELKGAELQDSELKNRLKAELKGHIDGDGVFCDAGTETNPTMTAYRTSHAFGYALSSD